MTKWITALMSRRVKPIAAWRAMRRLLADPDDTTQVFNIIEALKGDSLSKATSACAQVRAVAGYCKPSPILSAN